MSLFQSQSDITIHIPPDLKTGATLQADKPLAANVYAFATYIFQQLNRWPQDGSVDFSKAIYALSSYLTPSFRESLVTEMETKASRGELAGRERGMTEIVGLDYIEEKVQVVRDGLWLVQIDMELRESVKGVEVKRKRLRYPIRVIRYDVDRETNPWGLALDGYELPGPQALPDEIQE